MSRFWEICSRHTSAPSQAIVTILCFQFWNKGYNIYFLFKLVMPFLFGSFFFKREKYFLIFVWTLHKAYLKKRGKTLLGALNFIGNQWVIAETREWPIFFTLGPFFSWTLFARFLTFFRCKKGSLTVRSLRPYDEPICSRESKTQAYMPNINKRHFGNFNIYNSGTRIF